MEEERKNVSISLTEPLKGHFKEERPEPSPIESKEKPIKAGKWKKVKGAKDLNIKKLNSSAVKRLLLITISFWKVFFLANLFLLISTVMQIIIPYISGKLIDSISNGKDPDSLRFYGLVFLGAFLINGLALFLENVLFPVLTEKIAQKMRNDMFKHVIYNDMEFFDNNKTGDLLSRITSDIMTVKLAAGTSLSQIIKSFSIFIVSFLIMFYISWRLSMIFVFIIPLLIFMTSIFTKKKKMYDIRYQEELAVGTIIAEESFSSIRTVRSFAGEGKEFKRFEDVSTKVYTTGFRRSIWSSIYYTGTRTIANSIKLIVFWYGGYLALEGLVTPGDLVSFMLFTSMFSNNSRSIGKEVSHLVAAFAVSERIFEILDWKPRINVDPALRIDTTNVVLTGKIDFNDISFAYSSKTEVASCDGVSLKINSGEVVAFVGKSGSGKTTIMSLLQRFYDTSEGEILLDGMNIKHLDQDFLHKNIGYVSQDPLLFSGTIEENLAYGVESYTFEELETVTKLANAWDFINDSTNFPLGFKTFVGERGVQVSGGQKQRIAIARALLKKPKILILDEATSSLDSENEKQVQSAIQGLIQSGNMTVLIIAHRLSTIMKCPRIIVLENGRIVEEGSHENLIARGGLYATLNN